MSWAITTSLPERLACSKPLIRFLGIIGALTKVNFSKRRSISFYRRHAAVHRVVGLPLPEGGRGDDLPLHPGRTREDAAPEGVRRHPGPPRTG